MRKTPNSKQLSFLLLCVLISFFSIRSVLSQPSFNAIERGFKTMPDSMRLGVYWYWISDNISKEGVVKDLEAMKAEGINCAFIGNVGIDGVPYGDVKILTDQWWDILHTALKRAGELDIEIGIFNSPGWSQSGGPWVKNNQSMRYLATSNLMIKGAQKGQIFLPEIADDATDVSVIAYPIHTNYAQKYTYEIHKLPNKEFLFELPLNRIDTIRSFVFTTTQPLHTQAELYVKVGDTYNLLKKIDINRSNPALNVGFSPYAPIVVSFPPIVAKDFRIVFPEQGAFTAEVTLSPAPLVERYAEKSLAKMFQSPLPMWHDYLWDASEVDIEQESWYIDPSKVINITDKMQADGLLLWDVPEGDWMVMRTGMRTTGVTNGPASPEATGLEIDKMSKEHVAAHFDAFIGEILRRIPKQDRKSFKVVVQDSYETGGQNWTDDMIQRFESTYGYSPIPFLPVFSGQVVGDLDQSDRFLWDLRRLVADRVAYDYVAGLREICHQHGLTTWLENYGHWGFPGEFLQYGGQSDAISGEFWSEGSLGDIENKAASSCGHIYGKNKIWAESFTSGGAVFSRYPATMKQRGDRFFTEGINNTLLHVYVQQPFEERNPGLAAWFGNEFNRKNSWFNQMDLFIDYLKRCNFMLQQGRYVADVAYFIGEDAPKMTGVRSHEIPQGYAYDYINAEILLTQASAKNGRLVLESGMEYRLLVLPPLKTMRPELLKKIGDLVKDGIVILGDAPSKSPSLANYPKADQEVKRLAKEIWGNTLTTLRPYGKGFVASTELSLAKLFTQLGVVPDIQFNTLDQDPLLFIHRTTPKGDIYFISNQSDRLITFAPSFRVVGKTPELWDPLTAKMRDLPEFTQHTETTTVPLVLHPNESSFIVFRNNGKAKKGSYLNNPQETVTVSIKSPWRVSFEQSSDIPEREETIMPTLQSWSTNKDTFIRYYSGTAIYKNTISLPKVPKGSLYLNLGKVMVMAKVKINGQYVGGAWTPPYRVEITNFVKKGKNDIEIEVVNNWMNRLIGDQQLPMLQRTTWTNIEQWKADSPLQESGLLGPVEIVSVEYQ